MTEIPAHVTPKLLHEGFRDLLRQLRELIVTLWSSQARGTLTWLSIGIISVICATAATQVELNFWNRPFYDAIQARDFKAFTHQLMVFGLIAGTLLVLNVAQTWMREMIKLRTREWLTRDLFSQWLKPGRPVQLSYAGEIGVNPDQRIHEDARRLTELSADLGIGLFQSALLLLSFAGVLWTLSGTLVVPIGGIQLAIPGYMVWCALLFAATGSWLTWWVGRPLIRLNANRYQRESELRVSLVQTNEHAETIATNHREDAEERRLISDLNNLLLMIRGIVGATARLTWITAGYGWLSIVAPIVIAAPGYFGGQLTFGQLMMVVGGFYQVNQSLRWFVDNFALLADWRATLERVMGFREVLFTLEGSPPAPVQIARTEDAPDKLRLENLQVERKGEKTRLDNPALEVELGDRVLILDKTRAGRSPLLPAIAGLWRWGTGKLHSPPHRNMMFLKAQPYFPAGSLRSAVAYPSDTAAFTEDQIKTVLARVGLQHLSGALDHNTRCGLTLTPSERMHLGLAQLLLNKPQWIMADGVMDNLEDDDYRLVTSILETELSDSAFLCIARRNGANPLYSRVINLTSGDADKADDEQVVSG